MPINIPDNLPAKLVLEKENIQVMERGRSIHQDIRPLEILILNLMPLKEDTETQWARLLGHTSLQINLTLLCTSRESSNTTQEHMQSFYKKFAEIKDKKFDGFIVTGAPVEKLKFEDVTYWQELCDIMEWSKTHIFSSFYVCWGAQAALYHFYGLDKEISDKKKFGIYRYKTISQETALMRGFDDEYRMPVSRYTAIADELIEGRAELDVLSRSDLAGIGYVRDKLARRVYMFNHLEYDADSLRLEYERDLAKGLGDVQMPYHYFPDNDPTVAPKNRWRSHAFLMIANWLDDIYQNVPYDISKIGTILK